MDKVLFKTVVLPSDKSNSFSLDCNNIVINTNNYEILVGDIVYKITDRSDVCIIKIVKFPYVLKFYNKILVFKSKFSGKKNKLFP